MRKRIQHARYGLLLACSTAALLAQVAGCASGDDDPMAANGGRSSNGGRNQGGVTDGDAGGTDPVGGSSPAMGGSGATDQGKGGAGGASGGADGGTDGGTDADGGTDSHMGGVTWIGGSGSGSGGDGPGVVNPPARCVFHTDAPEGVPVEEDPGSSGAGGASGGAGGDGGAGAGPNILVKTNRLYGKYLTDAKGLSLYIYGLDLGGDCNHPPVSNCYDTVTPASKCETEWPIFREYPRDLPPELNEADFGMIQRTDDTWQTTYLGWPLYYYYTDLKEGDITGQAVGVWYLAETILPNIILMRVGSGMTAKRYLSDVQGKTLYKLATDTLGTSTQRPISSCTGECLENFLPFSLDTIDPTTNMEASDFRLFSRPNGDLQVAYKGAPLYLSLTDVKSGDMSGIEQPNGLLAER